MIKNYFFSFVLIALIAGCSGRNDKSGENQSSQAPVVEQKTPVEMMVLRRGIFCKQLVSNGKLKAVNKSVLQFRVGEELTWLGVQEGSRVRAGQIIARLSDIDAVQKLRQAKLQLDKARLELWDALIGQGYDFKDSIRIPKEKMRIARIRSGYAAALVDYEAARNDRSASVLRAPFSGVISGLKKRRYERVNAGEEFCTLVNDQSLDVEFQVLESELPSLHRGQEVVVTPFSGNRQLLGQVSEISPMVDENGLVKVMARIGNNGQLLDGMNVKVLILTRIPNQLIVPKSAVLMRDNLHVLFRLVNGAAYWTYVNIVGENSDSYAVIPNVDRAATLNSGDMVIVSGNLNLAHGSKVVVKR